MHAHESVVLMSALVTQLAKLDTSACISMFYIQFFLVIQLDDGINSCNLAHRIIITRLEQRNKT